jgi:hypothetical protein
MLERLPGILLAQNGHVDPWNTSKAKGQLELKEGPLARLREDEQWLRKPLMPNVRRSSATSPRREHLCHPKNKDQGTVNDEKKRLKDFLARDENRSKHMAWSLIRAYPRR